MGETYTLKSHEQEKYLCISQEEILREYYNSSELEKMSELGDWSDIEWNNTEWAKWGNWSNSPPPR